VEIDARRCFWDAGWHGILRAYAQLGERKGWGMSDISKAREALVDRILHGGGMASPAQRRAAFDNAALPEPLRTLIDKVANQASTVTDEDIAAVRASGASEDQIFELVVCAAIGEASREYDTALAALDALTERSEHATRNPR
jgi:hypothetical protein